MRRMIALEVALLVCTIYVAMPVSAAADDTTKRCGKTGRCYVMAKRDHKAVGNTSEGTVAERRTAPSRDSRNDQVQDALKKFTAALADYDRQLARYNRCVLSSNPASCGSTPTAPTVPQFGTEAFNRPGNPPISAGQAAATAVARLQLPTIAPGIGPSPELNPWKIAAVGYPLWLWADGPTHIGPVSDSVAGLSVSLDAKVSNLTFRMGDGHSITCAGSGHRWTTAVEPGMKSPSCGYSYAKPSLPDRNYTVAAIANWAVTWTSNGQSGVINVPAVGTTQLPVGELQVLVR
jgi:hypothetical protein